MSIAPIFFPTRVVLIDDEPQILRMTERLFRQRRDVADVLTFPEAGSALAFLENEQARMPKLDAFAAARVRDEFDDDGPVPAIRRQVEIRLADVTGVLDVAARRDLISVLVCDYAMPGLDGLEFFARITSDLSARRVLLTAVCDEQRAIGAFNRGLIHHFVNKADPAGPRGLDAMLGEQLQAFFRAHTSHLAAALALGPAGTLLGHPGLPALLGQAMAKGGYDEYSFCPAPLGFRLAAAGRRGSLRLADAGEFARAARVVDEIEGQPSLADALRERIVLPSARDGTPIYEAGEAWRAAAVRPMRLDAAEPLYWALVEEESHALAR